MNSREDEWRREKMNKGEDEERRGKINCLRERVVNRFLDFRVIF